MILFVSLRGHCMWSSLHSSSALQWSELEGQKEPSRCMVADIPPATRLTLALWMSSLQSESQEHTLADASSECFLLAPILSLLMTQPFPLHSCHT
ncbi:hypothetical protein H920_16281 [Fukomys damarensis]|uniref:Uncharacterized protein n=1 Tax=Fukomys damarensis TaxID=885580 RepID=A0A091CWT9_FUKDA|nr:hypothetical protein H920_16281 [Fukomys damarensis]